MKTILIITLCIVSSTFGLFAQQRIDRGETEISGLNLPDPLRLLNGKKVRTTKQWEKKRRAELLMLFENNIYGKVPGKLDAASCKIIEQSNDAVNHKGIREQVQIVFEKNGFELPVNLLIYLPKTNKKVPVFLSYNFNGNHTVFYDSEVVLTEAWVQDNPSLGIINNQITEQSRGVMSDNWPIEKILDRGYGLATVYYGEIDPDKNDLTDGIHPFFYNPGQQHPKTGEWGAMAAWAWGLTKIMDYLATDSLVDAHKVVVMGHSRLGKAALWAGALDERFAMVVSNESGSMGAALSNRKQGETVKDINTAYPYWFSSNFKYFNYNEEELPVDQHELIALIAPRPVYIASAKEDRWSDPEGEFLAAYFASEVYHLYGKKGIESIIMPKVNCPIMNDIGYHVRNGGHGIRDDDWEKFLDFADKHFK